VGGRGALDRLARLLAIGQKAADQPRQLSQLAGQARTVPSEEPLIR
jgi:hypothetical protein